MVIYQSNKAVPQQEWNIESLFKAGGLTTDEWVARDADVRTRSQFWDIREATISSNYDKLFKASGTPSVNFEGMRDIFIANGGMYADDVMQVSDTIAHWQRFSEIAQGNGTIFGFDTETFGDATKLKIGQEVDAFYGITEIGIGRRVYQNGEVLMPTATDNLRLAKALANGESVGESFIVGVTRGSKEHTYLEGVIQKFQQKGWESLTRSEKVTAERLSMYGMQGNVVASQTIPGLHTVTNLYESSLNIDRMKKGLTTLESVKTKNAGEVLFKAFNAYGILDDAGHLTSDFTSMNSLLYGANVGFDIAVAEKALRQAGYDTAAESISGLKGQMLDVVSAPRAMATAQGISVGQWFEQATGRRANASVDSQLQAFGYTGRQRHIAGGLIGSDIWNEGDLAEQHVRQMFKNTELVDMLKNHESAKSSIKTTIKTAYADKSPLYFHHGGLNGATGMEFGVIGETVIPKISLQGQFWQVDPEHTGFTTLNIANEAGELVEKQQYIVTLMDYADVMAGKENPNAPINRVVVARDTMDEIVDFIQDNATIYTDKRVSTQALVEGQKKYHQSDYARREWERLINPNDVRLNNTHDVNGFEGLKKLLAIHDVIGDVPNTTDSLVKVAQYKDQLHLNGYSMQSYVGLSEKIGNERLLIQDIIDQIDATMPNATNVEKTIAFRRAYNSSLDFLRSEFPKETKTSGFRNVSDKFGIDINVSGAEKPLRINAASAEDAMWSFESIAKKHLITSGTVDEHGLRGIIEDLGSRELISEERKRYLLRRTDTVRADNIHGFAEEIGLALGGTKASESQRLLRNYSEEMEASRLLQFRVGRSNTMLHDIYTADSVVRNQIRGIAGTDGIISSSIASMPTITPLFGGEGEVNLFSENIDSIASKLNVYSDQDINIIKSLFIGKEYNPLTKKYDGPYKRYALKGYEDQGLRSFLIGGEEGKSAFIAVTTQDKMGKFMEALADDKFDFSSYKKLTASGEIFDYAGIIELPHINEYSLIDPDSSAYSPAKNPFRMGIVQTVNQGENYEVFINPRLNVPETGGGPMRAYFNSGVWDVYGSIRPKMPKAVELFMEGDYKGGSTMIRNQMISVLEDMPSSSTYRSMLMEDGTVRRMINFGPADMIQGSQAEIIDGLEAIFKHGVNAPDADELQTVIDNYIMRTNMNITEPGQINQALRIRTIEDSSTGFQEYFRKHLFIPLDADGFLGNISSVNPGVSAELKSKSLFEMIEGAVSADIAKGKLNTGYIPMFHSSVSDALESIHKLAGDNFEFVDQITGVRALQKGRVSFGVTAGHYNPGSSMNSVMRPVYTQQSNGLLFLRETMQENSALANVISVGTNALGIREYHDKKMMAKALDTNGKTLPGLDYLSTERNFLGRVKNMNDYELQRKFVQLRGDEIGKYGFRSSQEAERAWDLFQSHYMSLHEGTYLYQPSFADSAAMTGREGIKMTMDIHDINIERTREMLREIAEGDGVITRDTVIGLRGKNNQPIYYQGADARFTLQNLQELLPDELTTANKDHLVGTFGRTNVMPVSYGDFSVEKLFINGAEKGVGHGLNMEYFMQQMSQYDQRYLDKNFAYEMADRMFKELSDNSAVIANLGMSKHVVMGEAFTKWNTIVDEYTKAGKIEDLYAFLKSGNISDEAKAGIEFALDDTHTRLLWDDVNAHNAQRMIDELYTHISSSGDAIGQLDKAVNQQIVDRIEEMTRNDIIFATLQPQNINEHMGTAQSIDDRIRQSMRIRGIREQGIDETAEEYVKAMQQQIRNNEEYIKAMRHYAENYKATGSGLPEVTQTAIDSISRIRNGSRIHLPDGDELKSARRTAIGIFHSVEGYFDPNTVATAKDVIDLKLSDFFEKGQIPRGGMTQKELEQSIFYIDGNPSQFLLDLVGGNEDALMGKTAIRLDLELAQDMSYKVNLNGVTETKRTRQILIPIQDISSMKNQDKYFIMNQQSATASMLSRMRNLTKDGVGNLHDEYSKLYSQYISTIRKQLETMNKDSDIYKIFNQYQFPNSIQVMARNETAPLTRSMVMDKRIANAYEEQAKIAKRIATGDFLDDGELKVLATNMQEQQRVLREAIGETAKKVRAGDKEVLEGLSGLSNKYLDRASRTVIGGETYFGMVAAVSTDVLERQGLNFNAVAMDVINEWESRHFNGTTTGMVGVIADEEFEGLSEAVIQKERKRIAKDITKLGLEDANGEKLVITTDKGIIQQLDDYFKNTYILKKDKQKKNNIFDGISVDLTIESMSEKDMAKSFQRRINQEIANGNTGVDAILSTFSVGKGSTATGLGYDYMEQVGTYSNIYRYPVFNGQPVGRVLLSRELQGNEITLANHIFTYRTHVDFDGDTMFLSTILDGMSVMKDNEHSGFNYYRLSKQEYEQFVQAYSREGLAEALEDGLAKGELSPAFTKDIINSERMQKASLLRTFYEEDYAQGFKTFVEKNPILLSGLDKNVQEFLYDNSRALSEIFDSRKVNMIQDQVSKMSGIAARWRNLNIGSVSTPNYALRNTMIAIGNAVNESGNISEIVKYNSVMSRLVNVFSKEGGMLTIAEQKAIDTKKALDALQIARTGMYSSGMTQILNASNWAKDADDFTKRLKIGTQNLIEGAGPNVFKGIDEAKRLALSEYVANTTFDEMNELLKLMRKGEATWDLGDVKLLEQMSAIRGVAEFSRDYQGAALFGSILDKNVAFRDLHNQLSTLSAMEGLSGIAGTAQELPFKAIKTGLGEDVVDYMVNQVYFAPGNPATTYTSSKIVDGKPLYENVQISSESYKTLSRDRAYLYEGNGVFREVNMSTGEKLTHGTRKGSTNQLFKDSINATIAPVSYGEFSMSASLRARKTTEIEAASRINALNYITENLNNVAQIDSRVARIQSIEAANPDMRHLVSTLFTNPNELHDNGFEKLNVDTIAETRKIAKAYDFALSTKEISPVGGVTDSSGFLRKLNADIAAHPEWHSDGAKVYHQIAYDEMAKLFGNNTEALDKYMSMVEANTNFDFTAYRNAIDNMRKNTYNIDVQRSQLNTIFDSLQKEIDAAVETGATTEVLEPARLKMQNRTSIINEKLAGIELENKSFVQFAQDEVYAQFGKDFKKGMTSFFGWDTHAGPNSIVGFGTYMGTRFSELGIEDIKIIQESEALTNNAQELFAVQETKAALSKYFNENQGRITRAKIPNVSLDIHRSVLEIQEEMAAAGTEVHKHLEGLTSEQVHAAQKAMEEANESVKRKSISGELFEKVKGLDIKPKAVVGVVGALAAIGLVNNAMHKGRKSSPLVPAQSNTAPDDKPSYEAPASAGAGTGQKSIYVDKPSGLQFKISAKTRNKIDAQNNAKLLGMAGQNAGNINSYADNSRVSDNWLANKFAELSG